jgi:dTMP kinase
MVKKTMNRKPQPVLSHFIVLEGLDGSGTTTQRELLTTLLTSRGVPVAPTCEPTRGPVGNLIRNILRRETAVRPETLARLFAADRAEHLGSEKEGIHVLLEAGKLVLCDRYLFSSLAYQSLETDFDFVLSLNADFPLPQILFYIDTPLAVCAQRRQNRSGVDLFEDTAVQERVARSYERVLNFYASTTMRIVRVDGTLSSEKIRDHIWTIINGLPIVKG